MPGCASRSRQRRRALPLLAALAGVLVLSGCLRPTPCGAPGPGGSAPRPGLSSDRVAPTGDEEVILAATAATPAQPAGPTAATVRQPDPAALTCRYERLRNDAADDYRIALFLTVPAGYEPGSIRGSYRIFSDDFAAGIAPASAGMVTMESFTVSAADRSAFQDREYRIGQRQVQFPGQLNAVEASVSLGAGIPALTCREG